MNFTNISIGDIVHALNFILLIKICGDELTQIIFELTLKQCHDLSIVSAVEFKLPIIKYTLCKRCFNNFVLSVDLIMYMCNEL